MGSQPRLQPPVVALDPVVGVLVGAVPCRWQQVLQHGRVHRRLSSDCLGGRDLGHVDRSLEEPMGRLRVALWRDQHVDDLPEPVDRAVDVAPPAGDLHIRLVHGPAISHAMPAGPGGLGQQRREAQHPPVDGDVVGLDPTLGEELLEVAVGQAKRRYQRTASTITSDGNEAGEGGSRDWRAAMAAGSHARSLAARTPESDPTTSAGRPAESSWRSARPRPVVGAVDHLAIGQLGEMVLMVIPDRPAPERRPGWPAGPGPCWPQIALHPGARAARC